jgi:hypothetical protein
MIDLEENVIIELRNMAQRGDSVGAMFKELKKQVGPDILTVLDYMRSAFCLSLAEAKPIASLSRTDGREVVNEEQLEQLVMPAIHKHRAEWDV